MNEETPFQPTPIPAPKKTNTGLIIGIVVAVLLCCCCLAVIGAFVVLGPAVGNVYESIQEELPVEVPTNLPGMPEIPDAPEIPDFFSTPDSSTEDFDIPGLDNYIPKGGLGDDTLRTDTWFQVVLASALAGCNASDATETIIEVLQKPDSQGMWKEEWTVTCDDGTKKSFDVTFTPSAQGGTDISVSASH